MVGTDAWSRATCDSSAMATLSRNVRWTRVLTVRSTHVAVVDTARPIAAPITSPRRCSTTPLPSSISHSASSASGSAASCDRTNDTSISRGSWRYPSLHSRHIDDSAGGRGSIAADARLRSGEDVIRRARLLFRNVEALRLEIEHGPVTSAERHQLVVRAELDDAPVLEDADAIRVAHGRKAMRDEDGRAVSRLGEQTIEDLGFAADVELRGRLVE